MDRKHKGGRGLKAENPYERFSVTIPPLLKAYLDAQAEAAGLNRSEMLAKILEDHQVLASRPSAKAPAKAEGESTTPRLAGPSTALTAAKKTRHQDRDQIGQVLQVVSVEIPRHIRGHLRWDKEKYAQAEAKLAQGKTLSRVSPKGDWTTEKGQKISWRTVKALLNYKIVRPM